MPTYHSTQPVNEPNISTDTKTYTYIGSTIIAFLVFFLLGIVTYKKYKAIVFRRQVLMLERIWLMNVKNNTYKQD
ncbi:hypothetical protein G7B40_010305 [Aetokthonos hydrillicola Thurmond2011]|jgi:hypothetical protein|uniref:Uncharacterized protein n=1 Tax=Aetokthonos hydrillicola Thurmond2011 TaxID=2712845 RepID=A0AAP5I7F5_9CYAN|nr:hypothetical protein [Aetokthonos hydrillicola]MBO3458979.1 hypothetical protein [Aetokthonos hydrillicola CCALA 1050]MBW4589087.1 hypothetical protein [Aetokthonos hydrillicola CCALA 1050]MDR9894957.1 hypothetical protein [Aetokthonos hydrillicola Thurmond2011]